MKLSIPKRKKPITRQLHKWKKRFLSVSDVKEHILREFKDEFPDKSNLDVGYFDGRQSAKIWLVSNEDLSQMYQSCKQNEISLWVECTSDDESEEEENTVGKKRQKQTGSGTSKRQHIEDEVDSIFSELQSRHTSEGVYSSPQLRLWARMIQCGTHQDYDDPPRVPQITGMPPKRPKKDSFAEALTGAAVAVAKALAPNDPQTPNNKSIIPSPSVGVSPGKSAELRMKNFQQLRFIQQLFDDNILSQSEFVEQKAFILDALRKLA